MAGLRLLLAVAEAIVAGDHRPRSPDGALLAALHGDGVVAVDGAHRPLDPLSLPADPLIWNFENLKIG